MVTVYRNSWRNFAICSAWFISLASVVVWPFVTASPTLGDDLTRHTVRVSLAFYLPALTLMIVRRRYPEAGWDDIARTLWTLAWAAYIVHLAMAFHYYHEWSHAHAMEHTESRSGFGQGIYFSHLFTLLWTADVAYWWLSPEGYLRRSSRVAWLLHAYMLFVVFNATVVYEQGFIRWAGVALFVWLIAVWSYQHFRSEASAANACVR